jgi:hypothetical protein
MIRIAVLIGLLLVMFYCAAAAPARAQESSAYAAMAARAEWHAQRQLLPGSLLAHSASARELAVAAHATVAEPQA